MLLAATLLCWAGRARAGDALVQVVCSELSREQAAEVEARIRASLLMSQLAAPQVSISCQSNGASVAVASDSGTLQRAVPLATARLQDDLMEAVDALLRELSERHAHALPEPEPEPEPESEPPSAAPTSAAVWPAPDPSSGLAPPLPALLPEPVPITETALPVRPRGQSGPELGARATAELWSRVLGVGGDLSFSQGAGSLRYGLLVGGAAARNVNAAFGVTEWHARVELGWQPPWAHGFRAALGVGPSLLVITPESDTAPRAGTVAAAWFGELALSRPMWLGRWAFAPSVSLGLFSARRRVNVDATPRFTLSGFSPALALGLIYAVN